MTTTLLPLFHVPSETADKIFLETPDGSTFTYRRFFALTARLAHALRACGVEPGDRVAVQTDKSPEALALYVACVRAGAVYLPLNTAYTGSEVAYFVGDAEPRLVVCRPASRPEIAAIAAKVEGRAETLGAAGEGSLMALAAGQPDDFEDHPAGPDDLAAILYTSGTTGTIQGRDDDPSQSRLERADAASMLAFHRRRRAAPCAADLSHARPVRGDERGACRTGLDAVPAEVRCRRGDPAAAAGERR